MIKVTKDNAHSFGPFMQCQKKTLTQIARMDGPFEVETLEGPLVCHNGYLALDNAGNPYPIDYAIFQNTYERVR